MKLLLSRANLERYQVLFYAAALAIGGGAGSIIPEAGMWLERMVWPALAALLYATFCQVNVGESVGAFRHGRFFAASMVVNFLVVPLVVWGLVSMLPAEPALRLGVALVLLVPCTDWFVSFSHLAGGDTRLAVAVVPVQLLVQFALLPLYLWLFLGQEFLQAFAAEPFLAAFTGLIVIPFALAALTRRTAGRYDAVDRWLGVTSWLPVPFLALTLFLIAASQVSLLGDLARSLAWAGVAFVIYLLAAAPLARAAATVFGLGTAAGRTLSFNVLTRNSFVVLPMALALPVGWEGAVAVVVLQSLVELTGIVGYVWAVPRWLFPTARQGS